MLTAHPDPLDALAAAARAAAVHPHGAAPLRGFRAAATPETVLALTAAVDDIRRLIALGAGLDGPHPVVAVTALTRLLDDALRPRTDPAAHPAAPALTRKERTVTDLPDLDPTDLTPTELCQMLRAWAKGIYSTEAAVDLLIAHDCWLRRRDFVARCTWACADGWDGRDTVPMAGIDWDSIPAATDPDDAEALGGSSSELRMLRLAASLAGTPVADSLGTLLAGLDEANTRLVLDAIAHRKGWHEQHLSAHVTGHITRGSSPAPAPGHPGQDVRP